MDSNSSRADSLLHVLNRLDRLIHSQTCPDAWSPCGILPIDRLTHLNQRRFHFLIFHFSADWWFPFRVQVQIVTHLLFIRWQIIAYSFATFRLWRWHFWCRQDRFELNLVQRGISVCVVFEVSLWAPNRTHSKWNTRKICCVCLNCSVGDSTNRKSEENSKKEKLRRSFSYISSWYLFSYCWLKMWSYSIKQKCLLGIDTVLYWISEKSRTIRNIDTP